MSDGDALLSQLRQIIGKEMVATANEPVGRAFIRQFAMSIEDDNPLYYDEEYARKTRYGGIVAPPTYLCETVQYLVAKPGDVDAVGGPSRRLRLPVGTEVRGGNEYEFIQPLRPDDVVTAHWKVVDVYEKPGKSARLFFLVYDIAYTNQRDELLAKNHEWLIFMVPHQP